MKISYFVSGVDILSDPKEVVCQGDHYYLIVIGHEFMPECNRDGEILLAVRKSQVPVVIRENATDDPPGIHQYFYNGYVADIKFQDPDFDILN